MSKELKYVAKKEVKEYKKEMQEALASVSTKLRCNGDTGFSAGLVGSAKRNLVLVKGESNYDVDYQCFISNKVEPNYRERIFEELKIILKEEDGWTHSQSTSVITSVKNDEKSFDVALVTKKETGNLISILDKTNQVDKWIWNELPESDEHSAKRKTIVGNDMWTHLRNEYKTLRGNQWDNQKESKTPSYALFNQAVNNTCNHFENKK